MNYHGGIVLTAKGNPASMSADIRLIRVLCVAMLVTCGTGAASAQTKLASITQDMHWRLVGPFRGGRTRAVKHSQYECALLEGLEGLEGLEEIK